MSEQARLQKESPSSATASGATRSSRSSTLPSQRVPDVKHRYKHKHHKSTSHRSGHNHRASTDATTNHLPSSYSSPLSPLGELLSPVKRNVTEGLSGVASWIDRDRDREKDRSRAVSRLILSEEKENISPRVIATPEQVEYLKQRRKVAERLVQEQYNAVAAETLNQHAALAESRSNMLKMFSRLDTTLASLSKLRSETEDLLETLTSESIPELTEESTKQLETFRSKLSDMEAERITQLQTRVDTARESTTRLAERMVEVRTRIKVWEEKDAEEDRRRRRRVGIVWATIGIIMLLIALLLIWGRMHERINPEDQPSQNWTDLVIERGRLRSDSSNQLPIEALLRSFQEDNLSRDEQPDVASPEAARSEADDGRLSSIFDEL